MPIELTEAGRGAPFTGDYEAELFALQTRLARLQRAQLVYRRRALVIFEGWEGSGLRATLKRLVGALDPCFVATHHIEADDEFDRDRHWLAPFWTKLPSGGNTSLFLHSWHRQLVDASVAGQVDEDRFARRCDEVNEFEAQQGDHDTMVIKMFFDVTEEVQADRLAERRSDPWKALLTTDDNLSGDERAAYRERWNALFRQTDTRWAPWLLIDGNDKRGSRIAALTAIADTLEKALPGEPPRAEDNVVDFPSSASR
ncbi:polyphosphate kinase 2 family protein [Sphingomicrobium clamense]|uniref:Polyphosphate kinase n=1 Tax=Sphingomicrobium clamense TaxID=2851013 RepID=A0ABS6V6L0_9SPHN|nr:polyphosphate kinase [Sphingomicrobium sp. B8]